jgi:branched-chain amino acid transport system substrate-binding protein
MRSRMLLVVSILAALALLQPLAGCGSGSPPPPTPGAEGEGEAVETAGQAGEPYKVGALVSITGAASVLGAPERNTIEMLQEEIASAGGIMGPDGLMHPVEFTIYDTESEETKAVLAAKKLIEEDQVSIILGPSTSGESLAVVDTLQKAGVPMISMASSVKIVEPVEERKWIFKVGPNDSLTVRKALAWLQEDGQSKVAWLSINNAYGDSGKSEFEAYAPEYGVEIVASERMDAGDTDVTAQLTKMLGTDADALIIYAILPEAAIAIRNQHDLGIDLPLYAMGGAAHPKFIELAGAEAAEGARNLAAKLQFVDQLSDQDRQKAVIKEYTEQYQEVFGTSTDMFGGHAHDAVKIALLAMEKVGPDSEAIRDELETMSYAGCSGIFDWSAEDHAGMTFDSMVRIEVADGNWILVEP